MLCSYIEQMPVACYGHAYCSTPFLKEAILWGLKRTAASFLSEFVVYRTPYKPSDFPSYPVNFSVKPHSASLA